MPADEPTPRPPRVVLGLQAQRGITETLVYLESQAGATVADRFLAALQHTLTLLASMPRMAPELGLRDLRRWPVSEFPNWLVLYRPDGQGITVIQVIHGSRDIPTLLEER